MNLTFAIDKQIEKNKQLNLLNHNLEDAIQIDSYFADMLNLAHRHEVDNIDHLISDTVEKVLSAVYSINQFVYVTEKQKKELFCIYQTFWNNFDPEHIYESILKHHKRLSNWVSRLYPPRIVSVLQETDKINSLVCAQYSPDFQLGIFHLEIKNLMEPIIDIGCGSMAALVYHLSQHKELIIGIDREIDHTSIYTKKADWLEFTFPNSHYGTIIANMSFSNHLLYHNTNKTEYLKPYLLKYREILESLKEGGVFVYAPSLPFIEERLDPSRYEIKRDNPGALNGSTKIIKLVNA